MFIVEGYGFGCGYDNGFGEAGCHHGDGTGYDFSCREENGDFYGCGESGDIDGDGDGGGNSYNHGNSSNA